MTDRNRLVDEFDVYGTILHFGNRIDLEDADEWCSWFAELAPELDGPGETNAFITVHDDDGNERVFHLAWTEIDPE